MSRQCLSSQQEANIHQFFLTKEPWSGQAAGRAVNQCIGSNVPAQFAQMQSNENAPVEKFI